VRITPIFRSEFSFEQFEAVLQKLAHEMALDALRNLKGELSITVRANRLVSVETNNISIRFSASRLFFTRHGNKIAEALSFEIEDKEYTTSNHKSKISYWVSDDGYDPRLYDSDPTIRATAEAEMQQRLKKKAEQKEKQVLEFLDRLMADVQPEPRFKLSEHARTA